MAATLSNSDRRDGDDKLTVLSEMDTLLSGASDGEFLPALSQLNIMDIFGCLQSLEPTQVQVTCSVLEKILKRLPVDVFHELSSYIELGLQHPDPIVIVLSLHQVQRCCRESSTLPLILAPTMFHLVTQLLGHESLEVVKVVHSILVSLCAESKTRSVVLGDQQRDGFIGDLRGLLGGNSTVRYRIYELLVEVAMTSEDAFKDVVETGILIQLVRELEGEDFLVKLNCIEMLIRLQSSPAGCVFLEESNAIKGLHDILIARKDGNLLLDILTPGVLKFFCNIPSSSLSSLLDKLVSTYPMFMSAMHEGVQQPNCPHWGVAVDVIGVFGSTASGRNALLLHPPSTERSVGLLGTYVASLQTDQRTRCLDSLCLLLSCNSTPKEIAVSQELYHKLGPNITHNVFSLIRQPFPAERQSGLKFLDTLASVSWGRESIKQTGGVLEYLLNRKSALGKVEKDLKYDIVTKLVKAGEESETLFGKATFLKLHEYYKEGPYHVKGEHVVAFQEV